MALTDSIKVLSDFALRHLENETDNDQRIVVYMALSETLPSPEQRQHARDLAEVTSKLAALQLDFKDLLP